MDYIKNNLLDPFEKEADCFANQKLGKDALLQFMNYIINERQLNNDSKAEFAIKEYKLRKKAIAKES